MKALLLGLKEKFSRDRFSAGLDIGTHSIKVIKLKFSKNKVELCGFQEAALGGLKEALESIKQSHDIQVLNVGVSGPSAVIRYVNLPKMNKAELRQSLKFEAQKHIPFPLAEINLDAYILKEDLPDNKMLVLLAAVKKEFLKQHLTAIEEMGFKVNIADIDSIALVNAFNFNYADDESLKNKTIALLNIGASMSNLNILELSLPRLSRDIHIAGNNFTQKITDTLGMDFKAAEGLKLNPDTQRASEVNSCIGSALNNLAAEIRVSFDYHESQSASSVVKIFLSGAGSRFAGLKDMLANILGIEVECWDPLKKINLADNIDTRQIKALPSQWAVAVGLALRK